MTAFRKKPFIVTNMSAKAEGVVQFYNKRGIAEQWIKEGMLDPKMLWKCYITQDNSLRLDCTSTKSRLFSVTRLIWRIFIQVI